MHFRQHVSALLLVVGIILSVCTSKATPADAVCDVVLPVVVLPENSKTKHHSGTFFLSLQGSRVQGSVMDLKAGGRHVAVLLDASGSMRDYWPVARHFAAEIVQDLDASDEVIYAPFGEKMKEPLTAVTNRESILSAISATQPVGRTALRDAIAAALARTSLTKDDAIVIISDGIDNLSAMQESPLLAELTARRVRVFAVLVMDLTSLRLGLPRSPEETEAQRKMREVVESTGGIVMWPQQVGIRVVGDPPRVDDASVQKIRGAFRVLTGAIDRPNLVRFGLPAELAGSRKTHQIELRDNAGHRLKGFRLVYPQQPLVCDQPVVVPANPN